jgi:DNA-binding response OmpR family regulator
MIARLPQRDLPPPLILVADEEPKIVEAIVAALQLHHYRVSVAEDGDEALRRAHGESPDLIIASVRLKGRGGLELCGTLRREVDWGDMPIMLLSAATDPEARVEALAHGADDLVCKPFSSRELVARVQRLVSRARETERYRNRSQELERDVVRLEVEGRRVRDDAERERSLRALANGLHGSLMRTLDLDELDARLLRECCVHTGARSAALLSQDRTGTWAVTTVRGDLPERWSTLTLEPGGACVGWVNALGRPALLAELERLGDMARELGELAAHGVAMAGVVPGPNAPSAVVVCEERPDGRPFSALERERFAVRVCGTGTGRGAAIPRAAGPHAGAVVRVGRGAPSRGGRRDEAAAPGARRAPRRVARRRGGAHPRARPRPLGVERRRALGARRPRERWALERAKARARPGHRRRRLRARRARRGQRFAAAARGGGAPLPGAATLGPERVRELAHGGELDGSAGPAGAARRVPGAARGRAGEGRGAHERRGTRRESSGYRPTRRYFFSVVPGLMPLKSTFGVAFSVSGTGYIGDSLKPNIPANTFIGKLRTATL